MANTQLKDLLIIKNRLYDQMIINLEEQSINLENSKDEDLISLQVNWDKLSQEMDTIDKNIKQIIPKHTLTSELTEIINDHEIKTKTLILLNNKCSQKAQANLKRVRQDLEGLDKGQKALDSYKKPVREVSRYVDKTY